MGPKDSPHGLTSAAFETRPLGFLGFGIVALGIVFSVPPIPQDLNYPTGGSDGSYDAGRLLSGDTLKHLAAVGACGLSRMVRFPRPVATVANS